MPQTLLAVLAMVVMSMFALNQHRGRIYAEEAAFKKEINTQMRAIAIDRLEEISPMAFDEAVEGSAQITSSVSLTSASDFGDDSQANDVDDFHGVRKEAYRVSQGQKVWYVMETEVVYANAAQLDQASTSGRTKYKKATVKVFTLADSLNIIVPDTVTLAQTFACGSACKW